MKKKRFCIPCDEYTNANPCEACGSDTDKLPKDDDPPRDDAYERQAARDRLDGFQRTGGRDWT